ncbi:MAG: NAD-dependent epimerase/dehydratase family protein [Candidatus Aminicenantales bacterium]
MNALVTGASGFIGSHLVPKLRTRYRKVRVLVHNRPVLLQNGVEALSGDIRDGASLKRALEDTDIIFHLAAALGGTLARRREFEDTNVKGTENLLRAAREAGSPRVIHFSSAGVLGSVQENRAVAEDYPPDPRFVYDRTKLEGERRALEFAKQGLSVVVVRPGWVYGPGDRRTFKLISAVARGRFALVTPGNICQTPVHVDDLVTGTLLCAEKGRSGEIYHLAGRELLSIEEIVMTIADAAGTRVRRIPVPLPAVRAAAYLMEKTFLAFKKEAPLTRGRLDFFLHPKPLAIQKAEKELGYSPQVSFRTGMASTVCWYRDHGWFR